MSSAPLLSPRTPAKPMGFDAGEFAAGAARAVGLHLALYGLVSGLISVVVGVTTGIVDPGRPAFNLGSALALPLFLLVFAVPISLIATVVGLLPAYLLGRVMMRVRSYRFHVLAWCAFGVVFSGAVSAVLVLILFGGAVFSGSVFLVAGFVSGAVAIPLGWARTASNALREDRGLAPRRCVPRRARVELPRP